MKQAVRLTLVLLSLSLLLLATGVAQDQYTEGPVSRVTLVHILPGHFNAFMDDIKTNLKPIWESEKSSGLIESYGIFLNQTKASVDDWDIGFILTYKNFAAQDGKSGHPVKTEEQADLVDTFIWRVEGDTLVFETTFNYKRPYFGHAPGTELRIMKYRRVTS